MRSRVYKTLILCLLTTTVCAQYRLSGTVTSKENNSAVKNCFVYLNDGKLSAISDNRGKFVFDDLPNGSYTLHFTSSEFKYYNTSAVISNRNETIRITLESRTETLGE